MKKQAAYALDHCNVTLGQLADAVGVDVWDAFLRWTNLPPRFLPGEPAKILSALENMTPAAGSYFRDGKSLSESVRDALANEDRLWVSVAELERLLDRPARDIRPRLTALVSAGTIARRHGEGKGKNGRPTVLYALARRVGSS